jgi:glycosyltransferase involved in cell wall biosynthesis
MDRDISLNDIKTFWTLSRVVKELGPFDIIHGHSSKAGAFARLLSTPGARKVYTPNALMTLDQRTGVLTQAFYGVIERMLAIYRTDAVIAVSAFELAHAGSIRLPLNKLYLIPNAIPNPKVGDRPGARATLGLNDGDLAIGFVGRLSTQKAPERFVEITRRLRNSFPNLKAFMLADGELRRDVEAQIIKADLEKHVFIHAGTDAPVFMAAFDVLVMTSRYEGYPYVFLEALANGLPILTMRVGGADEAVCDGVNGFVTEQGLSLDDSVQQLAIILRDKPLRTGMSLASKQRSERLNGDSMISDTEALYQRLLRTKSN